MTNKDRLKILFIPAWYPSKQNSVAGIFIKEHAKAVSLFNEVVVLYSEGIDHLIKNFYKIENNIEDGIRTLCLRYRKSPIPKTTYFIYLCSMFKSFRKLIHEGWKPQFGRYAALISLAVNIPLNLWLIPRWGISGAAFASSIAYIFATLVVIGSFSKIS